jgi:hypothetical protein
LNRVHDPFAAGHLLARRVVQAQIVIGSLLAIAVCVASQQLLLALAVFWGAGSVAAGHWMFARRQMQGVAAVPTMLRRFYRAAAWKWLVLFALFALGLVGLRLPAGGLLTGLIAAQMAGTWALLRYG